MIDKKLAELGEYAEEIDKKDDIKLIQEFLGNIEEDIKKSPEQSMKMGDDFGREIVRVIDTYKTKNISDTQISFHMLKLLVIYIKMSLIEEKAALLDIDKNLYKKDMHFLFKGN